MLQKYSAALIHIAIALVTALAAVMDKPVGWIVGLQLAIVAVNSFTTYFLPLIDAKWQGAWKTGLAILGTVLVGVLPLITQGTLTGQNIVVLIGSALGVLASELGISVRSDTQVPDLATTPDPGVSEPTTANA